MIDAIVNWLFDFLILSPAGWFAGPLMFAAPPLIAAGVLGWRGRDQVTMGPDPELPDVRTEQTAIIPTVPIQPNYVCEYRPGLDEYFPLAGEVLPRSDSAITAQLSTVAAYFERIETVTVTRDVVVSHRRFDPLDPDVITVELPQYTQDTPLYHLARPPKPFEVEGFTRGWTSERIAQVLEAGRPQ